MIDTMPPELLSVSSTYDDLYGPHTITDANAIIPIEIAFSEAVVIREVDGRPVLELDTGGATHGNATYASGNGSSTLVFEYTVRQGDRTDGLNYTGRDALSLNGGTMTDPLGYAAVLRLPAPGGPDSLGGSESIMIDTRLSPPPSTLMPTFERENFVTNSGIAYTFGLDAFTLRNGETYVIAAVTGGTPTSGNAVQLFHVRQDGPQSAKLVYLPDSRVVNGSDFAKLEDPRHIEAFTLRNGDTYAMVTSEVGNAVQLIRVHENATLEAAGEARNGAPDGGSGRYDALEGPGAVDVFALRNGDTYALVASKNSDAVQLIRVHEDGGMSAADSQSSDGGSYGGLTNARAAVAFALRDGNTYALAGGSHSTAVQMLGVRGDGTLAWEGLALNDQSNFRSLHDAHALEAFTLRNGETYVVLAAYGSGTVRDGAVQLIRRRRGRLPAGDGPCCRQCRPEA